MKKLLILAAVLLVQYSYAQKISNVQKYTPSVLLEKGKTELTSFYSIYTQTANRNFEGERVDLSERQTFLNVMYQLTHGISPSGKINIGLDVWVTRALYDRDEGSPFKVLTFDDGDFSRTAVTGIGPRIRYVPFSSINGFSVQSTFLFPVADDLEQPSFTAHDRYTWFTQFFYDMRLNDQWRLFLEADFLYRIDREGDRANFFRTPLSAFLSYFLKDQKTTFFAFSQYSPRFENLSNEVDEQFGLNSWFTQLGVGGRYQLTQKLGLELSYANFIASRQDGAGYALNLAFRYIW